MPVAKVYNSNTGQWEPVLVGDTGPAGADATLTKSIRTETANTTLLAGDANQIVRFNGTSAQTLTVPDVLGVGQRVEIVQDNSGSVEVASGSGVTLLSTTGGFELTGQNAKTELVCVAAGEYRLYGDVAAPTPFDVQYLLIAGGGGAQIGGGGAGGTLNSTDSFSPNTNYSVTVGAGGTGQTGDDLNDATNGSNTLIYNLTSVGGGKGGGVLGDNQTQNGASGGSGGGGGTNGGSGTVGQGNAGGNNPNLNAGAGGGGQSSAGSNVTSNGIGASGGAGLDSSITGSSVNYAAGGGGGGQSSGGSAGGASAGSGVSSGTPNSGFVNTGGGGGGNWAIGLGGAGGSGVVILRYPSDKTITIGAGLTGTETTVGSDKVATITAGTGNVSWS